MKTFKEFLIENNKRQVLDLNPSDEYVKQNRLNIFNSMLRKNEVSLEDLNIIANNEDTELLQAYIDFLGNEKMDELSFYTFVQKKGPMQKMAMEHDKRARMVV